jgi:hypothetical protein
MCPESPYSSLLVDENDQELHALLATPLTMMHMLSLALEPQATCSEQHAAIWQIIKGFDNAEMKKDESMTSFGQKTSGKRSRFAHPRAFPHGCGECTGVPDCTKKTGHRLANLRQSQAR